MVSNSRPQSRDGRSTPRPAGMRTPMAWHFRERRPSPNFRRMSSASSSEGSSSDPDIRLPGRKGKRGPASYIGYSHPYYRTGSLRSSRSMPGISMGTTWDGRPCPVHGGVPHPMHPPPPPPPPHAYAIPVHHPHKVPMRRAGSMFDLRGVSPAPSFYGRPLSPGTPVPVHLAPHPLHHPHHPAAALYATLPPPPVDGPRSHYGSLRSVRSAKSVKSVTIAPPLPPQLPPPPAFMAMLPPPPPLRGHCELPPMPPPYLLPPGARPRPMVIPAGAEPLPVRDPSKHLPPMLTHEKSRDDKKRYSCCRGPMPFVWFVVILVSVGVVLGIILGATLG